MRMVEALVAHGGAGVAANEEGWFLLLEEKTYGEEGEVYGGCSCCRWEDELVEEVGLLLFTVVLRWWSLKKQQREEKETGGAKKKN